ncbi:adenosylcobinamide-GDP ribazoletransferase [Tunturiibacter lichenicola]|uniref:adenosylcobinamide-GDP ribazoletransferase n=1 Tax=Tunturiibacter lichenicola TaxID=2051959 RepID=UPI0021B20638|nr:adenosylcobinamide-GDP ribazoletransferase [Edaphobacter lichenicola]
MKKIHILSDEVAVAFQFLTRIPTLSKTFEVDSLSRAAKFFPLVGLVVGCGAAFLQKLLLSHLSRAVIGLVVLAYLMLITGCLHEDGLADTADGFGGGWSKDQILTILKDSRIGSYGAAALVLSLLARYVLLASLPAERFAAYVISSHVLCRWSSLPLSYFLPSAREQEGQGARIAKLTSLSTLIFGSLFSIALVIVALRWSAVAPLLATLLVVTLSGLFYWKKIGGVTGDCFGATNQLAEIAVYFCGVWIV